MAIEIEAVGHRFAIQGVSSVAITSSGGTIINQSTEALLLLAILAELRDIKEGVNEILHRD